MMGNEAPAACMATGNFVAPYFLAARVAGKGRARMVSPDAALAAYFISLALMTGPAAFEFEGRFDPALFARAS